MRRLGGLLLFAVLTACTGGPGDGIPVVGSSSGATSSSGGSSSGSSTSSGGPDPAPLSSTAYSTTCMADTDCVAVANPPCTNVRCTCATRAIAKTDQTRYQSDLSKYELECEALHPSPACGVDCIASQVKCCGGTCTIVTGTPGACP